MSVGWASVRADELCEHHIGRDVRIAVVCGRELLGVLTAVRSYPMAPGMPPVITAAIAPAGNVAATSTHVLHPATRVELS